EVGGGGVVSEATHGRDHVGESSLTHLQSPASPFCCPSSYCLTSVPPHPLGQESHYCG
ncbi:hypothetical protein Pmani_035502, partial [Petrolisthes manimaculis]